MSILTCPHCQQQFDTADREEATVGQLLGTGLPHIVCPHCKKCTGCEDDK